ncbi:hypothetical protein M501DRAFT_1017154 [Patellaria atrata CBS 101060]|uniref:DNA (cytosine-5)-methyltransferase 1 replication foci domain-containing protein n=1 Tax=Patellaria atrata CBS 101060 TaxID=1346257 RepID=A0A9P4SAP9_9PEZI|nr:hypothetical protein M501DRAFT_1017154 [Patellaria atrata CBS 101060]
MPVPESSVLQPRNPRLVDDNQWAEFQLLGVEVHDMEAEKKGKSGKGLWGNLLEADVVNPMKVVGKLEEVGKANVHLLRKQNYQKHVVIEVGPVTRFSYGQMHDGAMAIWAAGAAGWFLIKPSRGYREVYSFMTESIQLLYYVADLYRERSKVSAKEIFMGYAEEHPDKCEFLEDAADRFYAHKDFLILSMLEHKEGIAWGNTRFYHHMKSRFPEDFDRMREKIEAKVKSEASAAAAAADANTSAKWKGRTKRSRSIESKDTHDTTSTVPSAPKKDDAWWQAQILWDFMQIAQASNLVHSNELNIAGFSRALYERYDLANPTQAANYIRAHATNLIWMMEHKRRPTIVWREQTIHTQLSSAKLAPATLNKMLALRIHRRKDIAPIPRSEETEDSGEETSTSEIARARRLHHAQKGRLSVRRPISSKFSGKGTAHGKSSSRAEPEAEEDDEMLDPNEEADLASPLKRKGPSRPSVPRKRKSSATNLTTPPISSASEEDEDEDEELNEEELKTIEASLPLRPKSSLFPTRPSTNSFLTGPAPVIPILLTTPLRPTTSNAPGDVWVCTEDGCVHKVYGASTDEGKRLVREHGEWHEDRERGDGRIELVRREAGQVGVLGVSHLLKRIREMSELNRGGGGGEAGAKGLGEQVRVKF